MSTSESVVDVTARNIDHLITGASCRCLMCNKIQPTETQFESFTSMSRNGMVDVYIPINRIDPKSNVNFFGSKISDPGLGYFTVCGFEFLLCVRRTGHKRCPPAHPVSYLLPRRVRSFLKSMQMKCLRVIIMRSFAWH